MECIVTIDIGTSGVKIVAYDMTGNQVAFKKGRYSILYPKANFSEQDPEQVFVTVLVVLKDFLKEHIFAKNNKVYSLVFSASMHSVLPVDIKGNPLGNAIIWADNRAKKEADYMKESDFASIIYQNSGTPIHPMLPLAKIVWIKNNMPEVFKKAYKFISIKEYILYQFTNEYLVDFSMASATGLFNIERRRWQQKTLDLFGLDASQFSDFTSIFNSSLRLKSSIANSLGLPKSTKLIIGSTDGCLATIGSGVYGKGQATISISHTGAIRVLGNETINDEDGRFFNYVLDENTFISGGPTNNAGIVLEWFASNFKDHTINYDFEDVVEDLMKDISTIKSGSNGLVFLPYLLGERAPIWNSNARACYFGINVNHETKHFLRATIEGIVFGIYSIGKLLERYRSIDSLHLTGKYASLPIFSSIVADVFGKRVLLSSEEENINKGAALIGLIEAGVFGNLEEASKNIKVKEFIEPNRENFETYRKLFEIFERLTHKLTEEFDLLEPLQ